MKSNSEKFFLLLILTLMITACTPSGAPRNEKSRDTLSGNKSEDSMKTNTYVSLDFGKTTAVSDTSACMVIDKSMAITVMPDASWISEQQTFLGADGWDEVVSDNTYYQSQAITALEQKEIIVKTQVPNKRYYKFILADKSEFTIDKMRMKDKWGIILFDVNKNPVYWSSTSIDGAIRDIFGK